MRLAPELETLLNESVKYARDARHEFVSLEHVVLALTEDDMAVEIIEGCGGDPRRLRKKLQKFLKENSPKIDTKVLAEAGKDWKPALTLAFHRVVQRALIQVQGAEREMVTTGNLLISVLREEESPAVAFLGDEGVTAFSAIRYFSHGITDEAKGNDDEIEGMDGGEGGDSSAAAPNPAKKQIEGDRVSKPEKGSPLEQFTHNLNERAKAGHIDPLIGREDVIDRVLQVMGRRTKNNAILVGDPGVGKTAIADGLAQRIVNGQVPNRLKDAVIYSLDLGSLLAGTRYRGDFESRFKGVLKELEDKKDAILFIDEMHTLVGAGATSGGSMDASNLLKPYLSRRVFSVLGSTTYKEFRGYLDKDPALLRRFQKVDVKEPSREDAVLILEGLKSKYEEFHNVRYAKPVVENIIDLSQRFILGRPLPDKAIDLMDEVGSRLRLRDTQGPTVDVTSFDVETVISTLAQVPAASVSTDDKTKLKELLPSLKKVIFGQNRAIEELVSAIKLARTGLRDPQKPIGCFLFLGPTGVGKTEVCRQLAEILGTKLLRFDMSEYMEKHTVSRLVGAPPGYVGYDEGGLLTESVFKHPYAVLLLDEMEKAHPDVSNILLQVMDSGRLTDTNGKVADFRNVILIMTSNAGARELAKQSIGIQPEGTERKAKNALKQMFAPEFLNRLDAIISFDPLAKEILMQVITKFLGELSTQLKVKKVTLEVTQKAVEWLFEKGYDAAYGARPFARIIDEKIKKPLVDELLFGKLEHGGVVTADIKDGKLEFTFK